MGRQAQVLCDRSRTALGMTSVREKNQGDGQQKHCENARRRAPALHVRIAGRRSGVGVPWQALHRKLVQLQIVNLPYDSSTISAAEKRTCYGYNAPYSAYRHQTRIDEPSRRGLLDHPFG